MKQLWILAIAAGVIAAPVAAQERPQVKVKAGKMAVREVETPQFSAGNVGDKRWRPKNWLEVDLDFEVTLPAAAGGRKGSLDSMTINYYLGMNHQNAENKFEVIKGSFTYVNIPASETCHAMAFVSPATLRRVLQKDQFTAGSDMKAWGYEILVGGERVAGDSSTGSPWWEKTDNLAILDGLMLSKQETPFSILWGDYDVMAKRQ